MTLPSISLTEDQTLTALRTFIRSVIGTSIEVIAGQDNRVAAPVGADYVVMTMIDKERLATNITTYSDGFVAYPEGSPSIRLDLVPERLTIQVDVHGPLGATNVSALIAMLRSDFGVAQFGMDGFDVQPLYHGNPHQRPFVNDQQQVENLWSFDAVLQCNPVVTIDQDFTNNLAAKTLSVQAAYGDLVIRNGVVCLPDGTPFFYRGWNWGRWGTFDPQDALDAKAQGATIARIPLRWFGQYGNAGNGRAVDSRNDLSLSTALIDPAHLGQLDAMVIGAANAGLRVQLFLDGQCCQNGLQDGQPAYCDPDDIYPGGHNLWADHALEAKYKAVLRFLAIRYERYVSIFEVQPEPNPSLFTNQDIENMYGRLMDTVRQAIPKSRKLFVVGPRGYDIPNIKVAYNPAWTDVIYTGDAFMFSNPTDPVQTLLDRIQIAIDFAAEKGAAIQLNQLGVNTSDDDVHNTRLKAILAFCVANKVPFIYWQLRGGNPNGQGFEPLYPDGSGGWLVNQSKLDAITASFVA